MSLSPTTKLEAVNTMLTSIGEQPIQNLNDLAGLSDASIAEQILDNVSRAVQSRGWVFNTDIGIKKPPNQYNEIDLAPSELRVDTQSRVREGDKDYVERGRKLYDRVKNTFKFDGAITLNIIKLLTFDDLPEPARRYIAIRSARIFHDRVVGAGELHRFYQEDEFGAYQALLEYEGDVADYNIFDNYDVYRVVDRHPHSTFGMTRNLVDSSETD